jgi:hypothetical protein
MSFHATNYTISIVLLMALTVFMAGLRMRASLENNWLLLYWIFVTLVSFRYPKETFDPRIIMIGLATGLLLRFEFLGGFAAGIVRLVEFCVWAYILYMGLIIVTTA